MNKQEELQEWLEYAEQDLISAEILFNNYRKPIQIICFHCQQSTEKYLKAFLVSKGIEFEKKHDLIYLNFLCTGVENEFSSIDDKCYFLNPFSVITRYPSEMELIEKDAESALIIAREIKDFVKIKIETNT